LLTAPFLGGHGGTGAGPSGAATGGRMGLDPTVLDASRRFVPSGAGMDPLVACREATALRGARQAREILAADLDQALVVAALEADLLET
jgi:hypothetical protein